VRRFGGVNLGFVQAPEVENRRRFEIQQDCTWEQAKT
jgi:hypothetical protein